MIRVISVYRVSQEHVAQAGETTSCKQQVRSLLKRGVLNLNPKKAFLKDIRKFIIQWREKGVSNEVILMADMNEYIGDKGELADFLLECDLVDYVSLLNPYLELDPTYLWASKRIDYIFVTPALAEVALKAGHHQFHQHFISDHKGVYIQFRAHDLFDTQLMDKSHKSYRRLRLGRRDIVERYLEKMEYRYEAHKILERAEALKGAILKAHESHDEVEVMRLFNKLNRLDRERVNYMVSTENYSGRPPSNGVYEWSSILKKSGRTITYWKLRLSLLGNPKEATSRLIRLKRELQITDEGMEDKIYVAK